MYRSNLLRPLFCNLSAASRCKHVKIGCASGFWGDTSTSTPQLIYWAKDVNYIVYDYLSEITMSLLARAKAKKPEMGYCPDFVQIHMSPYLKDIKKKGIKIVSNAGGLNPIACAETIRALAEQKDIKDLNVAAIVGDDLSSTSFDNFKMLENDTVAADTKFVSVNSYFGAGAIKKALDLGADIIVTGRCVDSALVLGPLMHEYDWSHDQYDQLATGSLAGHLIECGAQVTGGIFTDWINVEKWSTMGFPIVEFGDDPSSFVVTKPENTGGQVSFGTVAEQLVYEIGDPASYLLPDVNADFSNVKIQPVEDRQNAVQVSGAKGLEPTDSLKVTATYMTDFRCTAVATVVGKYAVAKARKTAYAILNRCESIFEHMKLGQFSRVHVHVIGSDESYGAYGSKEQQKNCREAVLWIAVEHKRKDALGFFAREIAPAGTGMAPGLTGIAGGRPNVAPILKHVGLLTPKSEAKADIYLNGSLQESYKPVESKGTAGARIKENIPNVATGAKTYRVEQLAYTRSGDKGDTCNIGVITRNPEHYDLLRANLTSDVVGTYFEHYLKDKSAVRRYELPGVCGLNFVLPNSLGGGGLASLRIDPQGKGYGQMLLDLELNLPDLGEL